MGAFADLRDRVGDALDTVCVANPDWSVLRLPVDSLAPPAYMLGWSDPWVSGQATFCRYDVALDVRCIAARIEPDPGIELLEEMIEAAAVALDQARLPVRFVLPPRPFPIGGVTYQAALLTVTATVQLTAPAAPVGGVSGAAHLTAVALLTAAGTVIAAAIVDGAVELDAVAAFTAAGTVVAAATVDGAATMTADAALTAAGTVIAAVWSPANIPGLVGWYDADDLATITAAAGKVSQWGDKSSGAHHVTQATSGNQPTTGATIGGRNALTFAGTWLTAAAFPFPTGPRFLAVVVARTGSEDAVAAAVSTGMEWRVRTEFGAPSHAQTLLQQGVAHRWPSGQTDAPTGTPYQPAVQYDAGAQTVTTFRGGVVDGTPVTGVTYTGAAGLMIGGYSGANLTGTLAELVIVDGVVSPADRAALAAYFAAKWTAAP